MNPGVTAMAPEAQPASAWLVRMAWIAGALALLVGIIGLVATLVWTLGTLATRPLDVVEGEILFEASRLREGLPLYVDPRVGAPYAGSLVPARYYVLYIPVWSAIVSLVPAKAAFLFARGANALAWLGTLARAVVIAPRERRIRAATVALFFGGAWVLALHGCSGKPDGIAVAVAGAALLRSVRRGRVDALAGALFVLAFFLKPNAIGAAPGAILASVWLARRRLAHLVAPLVGVVAATVTLGVILTVASGGTLWITHLLASTGQPPVLALWKQQVAARGPFYLLPLAGTLGFGVLAWRRSRAPEALVATCALATSAAWCFLCLAKIGSASNYFLEPGIAAVTLLACVAAPVRLPPLPRLALALALAVQSFWIGVASVRSVIEEMAKVEARADMVANARSRCGAPLGSLVAADEPGLEMMLDGRILQTPFQTSNMVRRGKFDVATWKSDLSQPEVACLLLSDDVLERAQVDPLHDRFGPDVRRLLADRFEPVATGGEYRLYRARW